MDFDKAEAFLESNHRQGSVTSSVGLGLYTGSGELVSLMTFGKMRSTIGSSKSDSADIVELVRFCNLKNYSVVGGASKLFKHYIREYSPSKKFPFQIVPTQEEICTPHSDSKKLDVPTRRYVWVNLSNDFLLKSSIYPEEKSEKTFQ